jgi:lipopolysaccharide transport system ATP-binding protein
MSSDWAIRVHDVSKRFRIYAKPEHRLLEMLSLGRIKRHRDFDALRNVSLEVRRGETVGIVGRNGCGKSTLLQIVCGILQPTQGTVETRGRIAALLELGAGFNGEFTGRENVYLNGAIHGRTRAEMDERFDAIAAFADIGDFIEQPVKTYSSGMFVRLAFATAINVDPDILVVDEALAVGDEAFQRKCFARIEQIKERGGTILFVSHAAQAVIQLCDRAILVDGGERLSEGKPIEVITQYQQLINSSAAVAREFREELRNFVKQEDAKAGENLRDVDAAPPREGTTAAEVLFDPGLVPASAIHHEERGARISEVRITDRAGRTVNLLRTGQSYTVEFDVEFTDDAVNVGVGMFISNLEGIAFAGVQTALSRKLQIPSVEKSSIVHVKIEFSCRFLPNTYSVTCTVLSMLDTGRIMMHRIRDACLFKVLVEEGTIATGYVHVDPVVQTSVRPSTKGYGAAGTRHSEPDRQNV